MKRASIIARRLAASFVVVVTAALCIRSATSADAHELSETSATLVLREGGHVELRLQIPWAEVLRAQWMPRVAVQEFLVRVTNQRAADFARELAKIETAIEHGTQVVVDGGTSGGFSNWQWPSAVVVQEALRRELMSRLAEGERFEHASRLPAIAEHTLGRERTGVRLKLPVAFGPALLTVYRPKEQWLKPGELSAPISVDRGF